MNGIDWRPVGPDAKGVRFISAGVQVEGKRRYLCSLRGTSGRWYVLRFPLDREEYEPERTKFFPNVSTASEIFEELIK